MIRVLPARSPVLWMPPGDTGTAALLRVSVPAGAHVPTHVHPASDEIFQVLSGELEVRDQTQTIRVLVDDLVLIPRGTPHAWDNVGGEPARLLFLLAPPAVMSTMRDYPCE